ncbi:MAG: hypothetical protein ABR606_00575 [Vicinamibacterales bacterium]
MKRMLVCLWLLALSLSPVVADAQIEQGRLNGTVKDAQGGVLPGVSRDGDVAGAHRISHGRQRK